jgi:hypothetical protein
VTRHRKGDPVAPLREIKTRKFHQSSSTSWGQGRMEITLVCGHTLPWIKSSNLKGQTKMRCPECRPKP